MNALANKCLQYRAKNRLSQNEMAKRCKVNRSTIIKIEKGGTVSKLTEGIVRLVVDEERG